MYISDTETFRRYLKREFKFYISILSSNNVNYNFKMNLQTYVYTKLSPGAFYDLEKQEKNLKDFKMGPETPLLEQKKVFSNKQKVLLNRLDQLISVFIVTPLVVACWRGCWQLMDIYSEHFPTWEGFYVSNFAFLVLALCQNILHHIVVEKEYPHTLLMTIINYVMKKFYVGFFFVNTILHWRSGWIIMDELCGVINAPSGTALSSDGTTTGVWFTIVCSLLLFCMKCFRNLTSPPFSIGMDVDNEIFLFRTRYFTKIGEKTSLYVLDCLFSVLIVGTLVVFVWRGAWILLDILLFPHDEVLSAWGSLVIGYASVAMAFLLQPLMRYLCDRLTGSPRLLAADFFILFAFFGTVNTWRGIWNLLNIYFLPENPELSCWITHWVCLIILILLGCANSLLVRGVYIDAEEPAGKCVVFPCYYLRVILQEDKLKKLQLTNPSFEETIKIQNRMEKSLDNNHLQINVSSISINVKENFVGS